MPAWQVSATVLIHEIVATAERIANLRDGSGERVFVAGDPWRLLHAIERAQSRPSVSDLGRALGVSRQTAHEKVRKAERAGVVETIGSPEDRRLVQVRLTRLGRALLDEARVEEAGWVTTLLVGFERRELETAIGLLRKIDGRLALEEDRPKEANGCDLLEF